jgi:hypothetical protein
LAALALEGGLMQQTVRDDIVRGSLQRLQFWKVKSQTRLQEEVKGMRPASPYQSWQLDGRLRTDYEIDRWRVLKWFIDLTRKGDLTRLTPAGLLSLQEEYVALLGAIPLLTPGGSALPGASLPSVKELGDFQETIRGHVEKFLETGEFIFTDFTPTLRIQRDPKDPRVLIHYQFVPPAKGKALLYVMASLLKDVALPVESCQRCEQVFLKPRKDAEYCSRQCQSLHYAQKKRGDKPASRVGRPRKYPEPTTKGGHHAKARKTS